MFKNLKIIGTSHISKQSMLDLNIAFEEFRPDIITVELDKRRYFSLMSTQNSSSAKGPSILSVGISGYLFLSLGKFLQKKLGSIVGIEPGSDMKEAINLAKNNNCELALIDRDIQLTLKSFSKNFSFRDKLSFFKDLFLGWTSKRRINIDLTKVPKDEFIDKILDEIKIRYPGIYNSLIHERNVFMAKKLFVLMRNNPDKKILCVVGAGHKKGLEAYLKHLFYSNISF